MSTERKGGEPKFIDSRHIIQLGVGFKPFEGVTDHYESPEGIDDIKVPELYDYYLFQRRWVSLHGIDGRIDVISEDPLSLLTRNLKTKARFRQFVDHPFGKTMGEIQYKDGKLQPRTDKALLRFSFLLKSPRDYTRLLKTYGIIDIADDKFLLVFNLFEKDVMGVMNRLEQGESGLIVEKNIFNLRTLEEIEKKAVAYGDGDEQEIRKDQKNSSEPEDSPGRIAYVTFPPDIDKCQTINMTFYNFDGWHEREYPRIPVQPNNVPLPLLV